MLTAQQPPRSWARYDHDILNLYNATHELYAVVETCKDYIHAEELKTWHLPTTERMMQRKCALTAGQQVLAETIAALQWIKDEAELRRVKSRLPSVPIYYQLDKRYYEDMMELIFEVKGPVVAGIAVLEQMVLGFQTEEIPAREAFEREGRWSRVPMTAEYVDYLSRRW